MTVETFPRFSLRRPARKHAEGAATQALSAICNPDLEAAAQRVLDSPEWRTEAVDACEATVELVHLCHAIERDDPVTVAVPVSVGQRLLRRRLLELLRAQLITSWSAPTAPQPDAAAMLATLNALERVRAAQEPDWRDRLNARLSEPDALELVVEIAHDLRSPLTSIMFLAETLRQGQSGGVNDVQRQQLGIVYSAALGLVSIVSDVIDMARGGDSLDEIGPAPFSIAELFESVRSMVAPMAEEKHLTLKVSLPQCDMRVGYGVPLGRVLLNLVANAIKFTEEGYVELSARERGPGVLEFAVQDTGRGLPEEDTLGDLYQPFRRRPDRSGFRFSGTGLGLSICRRMVEAMGGELRVQSEPKRGTTFGFQLQLPPASRG